MVFPDSYLASLASLTIPEYTPIEVAQARATALGYGFSPYHYMMGEQLRQARVAYAARQATL